MTIKFFLACIIQGLATAALSGVAMMITWGMFELRDRWEG